MAVKLRREDRKELQEAHGAINRVRAGLVARDGEWDKDQLKRLADILDAIYGEIENGR